jgi:YidC/Oxa1 family membrane protein insertase
MAVIDALLANTPVLTNWIGKLIYALYKAVGNFGWTVVLFTVILKVVTSPLDIWQRNVTRKNNKAMKRMKPQLEKLQKQCGNDKQMYSQKQMQLYKKEGYSMLGACLPTVITLIIFFVVFAGFNKMVRYHNELVIYDLSTEYNTLVADPNNSQEEINTKLNKMYKERMEGWLWIKNVFMPDTGTNVVPTLKEYSGTGMGNIGASLPDNLNISGGYEALVSPVAKEFNKTSFWDIKNWNGYFILPILSILLNFFSAQLMKGSTPEMPVSGNQDDEKVKSQQASMKMMQYTMPLMIGIFSLFYSAAFTIYMLFSSLLSILFQVVYNLITKKLDEKEENELLLKSYRR